MLQQFTEVALRYNCTLDLSAILQALPNIWQALKMLVGSLVHLHVRNRVERYGNCGLANPK
jgi:hypothetical protein